MSRDVARLRRIMALAEKMIADITKSNNGRGGARKTKRVRRTGGELIRFRKMLKKKRREGVPVADLARKYNVSSAYIYTLP